MSGTPFTRVGFQFASYAFPQVPDSRLFDHVVAVAQTAEEAGFDSIWAMDHLHQISSVGEAADPMLEAYTTLAGLAALTSKAKLGVLVSAVGFRNPALLAKMITNIDVISKGRAVVGLGAGWHGEEYEAYGMPFPELGQRMRELREAVRICRAMFTEHAPSFHGKQYRIEGALNVPQPITPGGPPILIGGSGEKTTIPMIAKLADGCNFFGGPATVRHKIDVLNRACEAAGRDPDTITKTWLGTAIIADSEAELQRGMEALGKLHGIRPSAVRAIALCGTPSEVAERVREYRACGIDGVIVNMDDAGDLDRVAQAGKVLSEAMA
ncbi:LLM class F420-dependent oxidoreductase [Streptomyces sp. XD-27]|uniref:LLM class F420-dependent oxidoreductase n=1 Tax=Streptomyces sp. XD-27 TaxID=3062779 RepID=UPI0026F42379|nr:LLM class F420-dependent oxidoreductase [Streptomyces sp. XD-27]WKX73980.1 LLM class F420-dependent oxidoreductase [Streptomyces sp. XD-27]